MELELLTLLNEWLDKEDDPEPPEDEELLELIEDEELLDDDELLLNEDELLEEIGGQFASPQKSASLMALRSIWVNHQMES